MIIWKIQKAWKIGRGPGAAVGPRWGPGATPLVGVRGQRPLLPKNFWDLRGKNTPQIEKKTEKIETFLIKKSEKKA